ncbi:MAG TPA: sulfite exporter TauE/SafE family protein [Candidatus Angelobacter sp.]
MTFLYMLLGLVVGVFSGIVGIGGGILIIPALVYLFHMNQHKAQGTSLTALLLPIGALAFWEYYKAGNVDIKAGLLIALGFFVGGYFGGLWAQHISEIALRRVFGILVTIIGVRLLLSR